MKTKKIVLVNGYISMNNEQLFLDINNTKSAFIGMLFGAGIGIIFNSTGLGLPIGAGVGFVLGLILNQ